MITNRTATVIISVTSGIWLFSVLANMFGFWSASTGINGLFVIVIGSAFAMRTMPGVVAEETRLSYTKGRPIQKFTGLQAWWEKTFKPYDWKTRRDTDIAWLEHDLDLVPHQIRDDCEFCKTERINLSLSNATNSTSGTYQARLDSTSISASGIQSIDSSGNVYMALAPPKPEVPEFTNRELVELHEYLDSVSFMRWEEGDEITERNARGDICVTYTTPGYVVCKICDKTYLHKHEDVKVLDAEEEAVCVACNRTLAEHVGDYDGRHMLCEPLPLELDVPEYDMSLR